MNIEYKNTRDFSPQELEDLFLSVNWSSGQYPEKLKIAMTNFETVWSAWDGDKLVGMVCAMDDGIMTAYVHYLLVHPDYQGKGVGKALIEKIKEKYESYLRIVIVVYNDKIGFYESCGFERSDSSSPMFILS